MAWQNQNLHGVLMVIDRTPNPDILRELIDSRYTVYDVLPTFFNLTDSAISHGKSTEQYVL